MNNTLSIKVVMASLVVGVLAFTSGVQAETNGTAVAKQKTAIQAREGAQFGFSNNLFFGFRGNADVMELQEFLTDQGYYSGPVTGNYFLLTAQGVKKFQSANGVAPTGFFGPLTRGKANAILEKLLGGICQNETGCDGTIWPTQPFKITANSSLRGVVGKEFVANFKVTGKNGSYEIKGSGEPAGLSWSQNSSCPPGLGCPAVQFPDAISLRGVPTQAGKYDVTITATESVPAIYCIMAPCPQPVGRTAKANFTITIDGDVSASGAPVVKGVSGPTKLSVGATGTWSVDAYDPANGTLSYGVTWGDEYSYAYDKMNAQGVSSASVQTATFSHTYQNAGTYKIIFRVTNGAGKPAETSMTVQVGYERKVSLSYLKPDYGAIGTNVTIVGSGFTATGNSIKFGGGYINNVSSNDGTTLQFTIPEGMGVCPPGAEMCPMMWMQVTPGTYKLAVSNANGVSNELAFQVTR